MSYRLQLQGIIVSTFRPRYFPFPSFSHHNNNSTRVSFCSHSCGKDLEMEDVKVAASELVVGDPVLLDSKIAAIRLAGPQKLQVIADFDATLTRFWVNGTRGQSSHGLLKQGNPEYDTKRQQLYEYYHPLEFSPTIGLEEKTKLMEEWWGKTHGLLIEGGLTYESIRQSVADSNIEFREGVVELFEFLEERDIPMLIFSAGLADIIEEVLRQKLHRSFKNVKIVSNRMIFNDDGRLVSFKGKLIHSLNKNEHALDMAGPLHEQLGDKDDQTNNSASFKKRTNVLLLGDHIGDLGMSDGLNYETRISVGFLMMHPCGELSSWSLRCVQVGVAPNGLPPPLIIAKITALCTTLAGALPVSPPHGHCILRHDAARTAIIMSTTGPQASRLPPHGLRSQPCCALTAIVPSNRPLLPLCTPSPSFPRVA